MSETQEEDNEEKSRGSNKEREKEIKDLTLKSYYNDLETDRPDKDTAGIYRETFIYLEEWLEDQNSIDTWRDLEPEHLSLFRSYLKDDEGLSGLTRKQHFQRLRSFFRDQDDTEELVEKINGWKFERQTLEAKETNNEVNFLTIPEYQKIVDACQSTREELIIRGLWELGIRRAEFAELKKDHLNRDEQTVDVDNKKNWKTRTIPYSEELKPVLSEWLDYGGREQYSKHDEDDYLIVTQHSSQVRPNYINKIVRRVASRTEVNKEITDDAKGNTRWFPTARHFRNSYATHRANSGMVLSKLSTLMGHMSEETTARYCADLTEELIEANDNHRPKSKNMAEELAREF